MDLEKVLSFGSSSEFASAARDELKDSYNKTNYFLDSIFASGAGASIACILADYNIVLDESIGLAALGAGLRIASKFVERYFDKKLSRYIDKN